MSKDWVLKKNVLKLLAHVESAKYKGGGGNIYIYIYNSVKSD